MNRLSNSTLKKNDWNVDTHGKAECDENSFMFAADWGTVYCKWALGGAAPPGVWCSITAEPDWQDLQSWAETIEKHLLSEKEDAAGLADRIGSVVASAYEARA